MILQDGRTPWLPTPIPALRPTAEHHLRWVTEATVTDWCAIRHPAVGPWLLGGDGSLHDARTTRGGVAYSCLNWAVLAGVALEQQTIRPKLAPRGLLEQLEHVASLHGWRIARSEKGSFANAAADLFGGRPPLCEAMRRPEVEALLCAFLCVNFHFFMGDGVFPWVNPANAFDEGITLDTLMPPVAVLLFLVNARLLVVMTEMPVGHYLRRGVRRLREATRADSGRAVATGWSLPGWGAPGERDVWGERCSRRR